MVEAWTYRPLRTADLRRVGFASLAVVVAIASAAEAQNWSATPAMRAVETPGHEALLSLIQGWAELAPFTTDGCSGGLSSAWSVVAGQFPDFAQAHEALPPWDGCCVTHDMAYHNAGSVSEASASFDARLEADLALMACVVTTGQDRVDDLVATYDLTPAQIETAYGAISEAMFLAVRIGGGPCTGLPWRWGYGYPDCSVLGAVFD